MINVLFVCYGNICRSPMAEGIFKHLVEKQGLSDKINVDSAGTSGFHEGELADRRAITAVEERGIKIESRGRKLINEDFVEFDYILGMDDENLEHLESMANYAGGSAEVLLIRDFDPEGTGEVPDPYYGGVNGFEKVYEMLHRSCNALLEEIKEEHGL